MKRLVLLVALCGCAQHPSITVGVAAGSVGLLSCEINGASQGACGIIAGSVGLALGGIAALVTYFADTNAHALPSDDELLPNGAVRVHTHTDLPPVPLDGRGTPAGSAAEWQRGSIDAGLADVVPQDAVPGDAALVPDA